MALDPITAALEVGSKILDRVIPDPTQRDAAKLQLLQLQQNGELAGLNAQTSVIVAEAKSESWIASNWRPILMLTFGALIVARWFGLAAPNLSQAEYLKLWDIVNLGIGGYVVGRSVEKVAPAVASAFAK